MTVWTDANDPTFQYHPDPASVTQAGLDYQRVQQAWATNPDPTAATQLQAAGVPLSTTPLDGTSAETIINGTTYFYRQADLTDAQRGLVAQASDPYGNQAQRASMFSNYASTSSGTGTSTSGVPGMGSNTGQGDAYAIIKQTLNQYGLPSSLADWAWSEIVAGKSQNEVLLDLYQRPEFKNEFGAVMDGRLQAGLSPLSPGDIVTYRNEARQMMRAVGIPAGFADSKQQLDNYLVNNVSLKELGDRVTDWATIASAQTPAEDKQAFYDQGFGHGDLTAMFMNPDIAEPLLRQQVTAAQLGGASVRSGYGKLTGQEGLSLAALGVDRNQAAQGFGQLVHQHELFDPLNSGETQIGQADQLAATFGGNAQAQQRIQDRARSRVAAFDGGGGFAGTQQGLTAIGSSGT